MALPSSGSIDLVAIQNEFGTSGLAASAVVAGLATLNGTDLVPDTSMRDFLGKSAAFIFNSTITTQRANYNLRSAAIAAGWDGVKPLNASITLDSYVYIYSTDSSYAFDTGSPFPSGSTLTFYNYGNIYGRGGIGGTGGYPILNGASDGVMGAQGAPALIARSAITIYNYGIIAGGGGGGGGGGSAHAISPCFYVETGASGGGGGGGQGFLSGDGGAGGPSVYGFPGGGNGDPGYASQPGNGGIRGFDSVISGGNGGSGGSLGSSGSAGNPGVFGDPTWYQWIGAGGAGGAGGAAVSGNSSITWGATGTRYGAIA